MRQWLILSMFTLFSILPAFAQEGQGGGAISIVSSLADDHIFAPLYNKNDGLYEALAITYQNNPTVRAARAELMAVREQLSQAQSGLRPTITADADITHTDTETEGSNLFGSDGGNTSKSAVLNLSQPLYRGGRTYAEVNKARNVIAAQELNLSGVEQGILYDAVVAYMNVLRDEAVLALNANNYELVAREKEQAENRFSVGELTRTDVSQSDARLAEANANVIVAQGDLKRSRAVYRQVVGTQPSKEMAYPLTILTLPETLDEALSLTDTNNRDVLQSQFIKQAAGYDVNSKIGAMLPEISAVGALNKNYNSSDSIDEQRQASVGITASIPLYQAGTNISRVREAKKIVNRRAIQIIEARERAGQKTIDAWESLAAAQAEVKARQSQINAARIAREGVRYETEFGERTILDSLDASQELLDAQVSLITAKRNEVVARFGLARSLGVLVPQKLGFSSITP
jgi:TolC family type I secretion outer membrane protein